MTLTELSLRGPIAVGPDIVAATSLAQVRDQVISRAEGGRRTVDQVCRTHQDDPDPCWSQLSDQPGRVYLAVVTNYECNSPSKEVSAIGGMTLYFIHWVGNAQGVCSASMALPNWRLYSASRNHLPRSGVLTVRLHFEGTAQSDLESQVPLT